MLILMPKSIIEKVNEIGKKEKHQREFSFSNQSRELYAWSDEVPLEDLSFQGLLEP